MIVKHFNDKNVRAFPQHFKLRVVLADNERVQVFE